MNELSSLDRKLLDLLQKKFPIDVQPYQVIAQKMQCSEEEIVKQIQAMKENGIIRRIGAILDAKNMGFYSTLCACEVPEARIEDVAAIINKQRGVTHNYLRDNQYNIWFTLTASSNEEVQSILKQLECDIRIKIISMPTTKVFKIKVSFEMSGTNAI
ncbi:MAG: Lrp/AsnC family transcriptional regulator [Syntrophomonadaceae bacterium]|nr:Lrp/AsnC family transcriptional regulator [Syntrophomonadaceae bacterium]MDD3024227.1 Lrp/AsnC family transcriptional regulator [Syntrophomonadaceae bacterium]